MAALLVNTLTAGEQRGKPYCAPDGRTKRELATEALRSAGESTENLPMVSAADADGLADAADALAAVFAAVADGDVDGAVDQVNNLVRETATQPLLTRHAGQDWWHLHYAGTVGGHAGEWIGACAAALAVVLGSAARDRLGVCTAPRCDRVYVDTSHNGARRFCSTACQNRVKTAAFRARSSTKD